MRLLETRGGDRGRSDGFVIAVIAAAALAMAPAPPSGPGVPLTFELVTEQRWLHVRQQARFVPFLTTTRWIHIDSMGPSILGGTLIRVRVGRTPTGYAATGRLETEHRAGSELIFLDAPEPAALATPASRERPAPAASRLVESGMLRLPETELWDLAPAEPPALRAGARWEDTIHARADRGGASQRYAAARVSRVVGDTLTDAGRLWIIEDSSSIDWSERLPERELSLDTLVVIERRAVGTMRGRHLYDPTTGLYRFRADTTILSGSAMLIYPDGREYRVPARFERRRMWIARDSAGTAARARELEAAVEPRGRSIRLSLPDVVAPGDTAAAIRHITRELPDHPLSLPLWRTAHPFLADPGLSFAFGLPRDSLYLGIEAALLSRPPTTADTMRWACVPSACRALARQWEEAREPRLRDLGLIAHYLMDPERWGRVLRGRAGEGSWLAQRALRTTTHGPSARPGRSGRDGGFRLRRAGDTLRR